MSGTPTTRTNYAEQLDKKGGLHGCGRAVVREDNHHVKLDVVVMLDGFAARRHFRRDDDRERKLYLYLVHLRATSTAAVTVLVMMMVVMVVVQWNVVLLAGRRYGDVRSRQNNCQVRSAQHLEDDDEEEDN